MFVIRIKGIARVDTVTKLLVRRLNPGDIAVIDHRELDSLAANALVKAKVKAVINASSSISQRYPNEGPLTLVSAGITLVDNVGREILSQIIEGQLIEIIDGHIIIGNNLVAAGKTLTATEIKTNIDRLKSNMGSLFCDFVNNTIDYAKNELGLVLGEYKIPDTKTVFTGRHVLIVARGQNYREDLDALRAYIEEIKPLLIGVDGGADALCELGYRPDMIIGDMDSVSDRTLSCGAELVAHAYINGNSPGLKRISRLNLESKIFAAPGTSEDIAMLLAFEKKADLIVILGSHSNIMDFLEKGRKGMASTFLVRMRVGPILVDAKGVSKLYKSNVKVKYLAHILAAAMLPAVIISILSPLMRQFFKLAFINFKILLGV